MSAAAAATSEYAEGVACASTSRARRRHRRCDTTRVVSMRGRRSQDSNGRRYLVRRPLFERSQPTTVSSAVSAYERVSVTVHRSSLMRTMSPRRGAGTGTASPESAVAVPSRNAPVHAHPPAVCCGKCHDAKGHDGQEMRTTEGVADLRVGLYQSRDGCSEVRFR